MTGEGPWPRIDWDDLVGPERAEWYAMTPRERCRESQKPWETYLAAGRSLDPEPDPRSPFYDPENDAPPGASQFADSEVARVWTAAMRARR